jgi:hypothetical protein
MPSFLQRQRLIYPAGASSSGASFVGPLPPVAGPLIWLDANQETFANNDPVGQFTDWSGNGNHFTASGTARPTFKTNRINSRPAVQADGVDDGLLLASLAAQTAWSLFLVGRMVSAIGANNVLSVDDFEPDGVYTTLQYNGGGICIINSNAGAVFSATMTVGTSFAYCLTGNGSAGTIRSSNNVGGSTSASYSKASSPMRLFRRGDGVYSNFEISELLFYPSVLSSVDRTTIWTYFNTRYGTAIPATP